MPVTIDDIAKKAGVSKVTVSRILNGKGKDVRPDAIRRATRVRRLAEDLGYRPNWRAKAFTQQRTHIIGWLSTRAMPHLSRIYLDLATSFGQRLWDDHYYLMLVPVMPGDDHWRTALMDQRLDGFVVMDAFPGHLRDAVDESGLPGVLVNCGLPEGNRFGVCVDDHAGGWLATRHLLERGHRRIAFAYRPPAEDELRHPSMDARLDGYRAAMADAGLAARVFEERELARVAATLDQPDAPSAFVVFSDLDAIKFLQGVNDRGLRAPRDVSLVAFNDVEPVADLLPPLTVVDVRQSEMGVRGAEMLLDLVNGRPAAPRVVTLTPRLVERRSVESCSA